MSTVVLRTGPWTRAAASLLVCIALVDCALLARSAEHDVVEFNRDIRPILAENCYACHGPDQAQRKADLRLDVEAVAKSELNGRHPIVPGKPAESELARRIASPADDERMPPPASLKQLSPAQIETIHRWIAQGAHWQPHWSLIAPRRAAVPKVARVDWPRNPIDAFVLARLEAEGLEPTPEADKTMLARRVSLDLAGLPPTPAEVDRFLADRSPDAYERLVDRLLASPRYGERMAARWLDAARYADTSGYQTDGIRQMWRWRDWVIEACNENMTFDRFTIEQIAGDMLGGATLDQRIATGFNRNHRGNSEGGIIPEEYAVEYVVDRVETTATVWLGLTLGCARCHDHKFDPFSQREFYQLFALFNNIPEKGRAIKVGNSPPMIKAPTRDQQQQLRALEGQLTAAETEFAGLEDEIATLESDWSARFAPSQPSACAPYESLLAYFPLDGSAEEKLGAASYPFAGTARFQHGAIGKAADFDGMSTISAAPLANFGYFDKFTLAAWIFPAAPSGTVLSRMADSSEADGYSLRLADGKLQANFVKRWLDDALRVETAEPLVLGRWQHVAVTYDGSRVADGVKIYIDGRPQKINVLLDELNQSFETSAPFKIGGGGQGPRFNGLIDDARIYKTDLPEADVSLLATPETIDAILARPPGERTPRQAAKLRACFLADHAPPRIQSARRHILALRKQIRELTESFPTTMVMQEMPTPRDTFVLTRGQYDKPGEKVTAAVPASLGRLPSGGAPDRLALAGWLVDPANPLSARVAVNRFWQSCFGLGLVRTVDDFGAQGEPPSHPELLDWLASEFVASGWDMKAIQKLIVTSATYRQSSRVTQHQLERDPDNRLLARGPRFRLPAEVIRDQALAASGLLVEELGGPSVHPYQPPGLWKELTGASEFVQDHGRNLYRRSLYTFWKRTIAPPSMMTFDASGREACSVRQTRTNTPLQALALLNEVTYVEAARALAERVLRASSDRAARLELAFRLALVRRPSQRELRILEADLDHHLARFRARPEATAQLLAQGEFASGPALDRAELAAYTAVANLILNLDEVVTKE